MFHKPNPKQNFSELEDKINEWWKQNRIFEKSIDLRKDAKDYIFYDGPPFMSGMPHYATLLSSLPKDVIPRYQTMKGMKVERLWGWDCHGLPIENKVEAQLGLKSRKDIEELGLDKFIEKCYEWNRVGIENWKWYIDKIGRWADMDNAYRTMDQDYMESIWWVFKSMWEKGFIYKGNRTSLFSTDSSTPISNFEVSMDPDNYKDTEDLAVTVKFEVKDTSSLGVDGKVFLLAWTTTPWTLPSNFALAVNPKATYVVINLEGENLIFIQEKLESLIADKDYKLVKTLKGNELAGLMYIKLYDFFPGNENDFKVYASDYVTTEEGTGVLHVAPAFGEADFEMGKQWGLSFDQDIDDAGHMTVGPWKGVYIRKASKQITEDLESKALLFRKENYIHRLPYYRYANPLIYKVQESYFVSIEKLRKKLIETNSDINWIPDHFKKGRFEYILETAPDWSISRTRYWGTAMPVWENSVGEQIIVGSRDDLMELVNKEIDEKPVKRIVLSLGSESKLEEIAKKIDEHIKSKNTDLDVAATQEVLSEIRNKYFGETVEESKVKLLKEGETRNYYLFNGKALDLHRPYIDAVTITKDGKEYKRIKETLDVWMDSGSMPFAQFHYPFVNKEKFEESFPGDFIAEYTGQIRAWFYVLHVISNALFEKPSFKNVLVTGVLAGNDGRKMSKSFGNYPDPKTTLEKYGGEALRLYFLGSPLMDGNDMDFNENDLKSQIRDFILPLWNIYSFFTTYANLHNWEPRSELCYNNRENKADEFPWDHMPFNDLENNLDAWILLLLQETIKEVTSALDKYEIPRATRAAKSFIDDLSKWYIRRNRDRFASGDTDALDTLYYVLVECLKLFAPITPFITEYIYKELVASQLSDMPESVHLTNYPVSDAKFIEQYSTLLEEMRIIREVCEMGHSLRTVNQLKVRQPLAKVELINTNVAVPAFSDWMKKILMDELNVKDVVEVMEFSSEKVINTESSALSIKVGLDTEITQDLMDEGLVRDLTREIQSIRKNMNLNIGDKIDLSYETSDSDLLRIFENFKETIAANVNALELSKVDKIQEESKHEIDLSGKKIIVNLAKK